MTVKRLIPILILAISFGFVLMGCEREKPDDVIVTPFDRLLKDENVQSAILSRTINYAVLLPEGYDSTTISYPVVYLLHGFGDDERAWYQGGNIKYYADKYLMETGPVIFVMPEGFNTYWANKYNGNYPYMDMLSQELVPEIDAKYRTVKDPEHRAVMGYSMGGYGALILPAKNPELFKTGIVLSMSFRTDEQYINEPQEVFDGQWGPIFGGIGASGNQRLTDYFLQYSPFHFFAQPGDVSLQGQNYYFDCGDDEESLSETNDALHVELRKLNIPHEYRVKNGAHTWDYWHNALPEAFSYLGYAFRGQAYPSETMPVETGSAVPDSRIFTHQLQNSGYTYKVVTPGNYTSESKNYPVIYVMHQRDETIQEDQTRELIDLLSKNIEAVRLPASIIVELPFQETGFSTDLLLAVVSEMRSNYRINDEGKYAVLIGNDAAGGKAFEMMPILAPYFNACLLFDAAISSGAEIETTGVDYYLDITDQGNHFEGYHSLFMNLRAQDVTHEYRVRQGRPSHDNFLSGLDDACVFIKDHLKE
ncbi:MAG: alpha/beta hydrolase family protein [Lentimicrobium sp.]|jgi:enterochelin esterase-like enzyme|nr:alpha/beta hydrolase family protein [Lentimicrobium sp.]